MDLKSNETIYQIFIDRFARNGTDSFPENIDTLPEFAGGNIRGIINNFDHIVSLHASSIWLSPFYKTSAYHGYHVTDYFSVEPHFGTESDIQELLKLAHDNGIKIFADFIPNHLSHLHPYFIEAKSDITSKYRNWFYFNNDNSYMCFLNFTELPKLNLENPEARKYIFDAARYWLSFGFDGLRLDHVCGPSDNFWEDFITVLQQEFPRATFFAEAALFGISFRNVFTLKMNNRWTSYLLGDGYLLNHYKKIFPYLLDFKYSSLLNSFANGKLSYGEIEIKLNKHRLTYDAGQFIRFLDNHDLDRFMFNANNNIEIYKQGLSIFIKEKGPIVIYQGTELGVTQKKSIKEYPSYGDLAVRKMFPWDNVGNDIHVFTKQLLVERKNNQLK